MLVATFTGTLLVALAVSADAPVPSKKDQPIVQSLKLPANHPYLVLTPDDIARGKQRAETHGWAKQTMARLTREAAREAAKPLGDLPPKDDRAHWNVASRLRAVGLGFSFSGSREQAEWVRDGLLAYADIYLQLPWTNRRCRVFAGSSLYEAMWAHSIVEAYDLVADSGVFTAEQKQHVKQDLLRPAADCFRITDFENDPRIRDLHYRCYNFQAWHLATVGLIGLALRDTELVDYAVKSRYGFKHLLAHDVRDDGLFWERSVGYHLFVIQALLPFTEAMLHCGVDLYQLQVPNDRSADEDCHYVTDKSDCTKSLRMMFQAPFYLAFPDLSYVALGDSDRGPLQPNWANLIAWNRYKDPHVARLLRRETGYGGQVGFLHYYRYQFQYDSVRLNGQPIVWSDVGPTYRVSGDKVLADDGDSRQSDRYLLADEPTGDYTLEWNMTRLKDSGRDERAWLAWQVNPRNRSYRKCYYLSDLLPEVGRTYRFRMAVANGTSQLSRDGTTLTRGVQTYSDEADRDWHSLILDEPPGKDSQGAALDDSLVWRDQAVGYSGVFRNGSTLLPSSGVAVLREKPGDFTDDREALAVAFSYGPYGGGHGHPDKLSLAFYAHGRQWIPQYGSMPYETTWKTEWTSHTISHNTVVVDGVSQQPAGRRNAMWPVDTATNRVVGRLEQFDPERRSVTASCDNVYPEWLLRRQLRLARRGIVDRFDVEPRAETRDTAEHHFDYVLHIDGQFVASEPALADKSGPLGDQCGYQHLQLKAAATVKEATRLDFSASQQKLRIWILPGSAPLEIMVADGLTNSPDEKHPVLLVRRRGSQARFLTFLEPLSEKPALTFADVQRALAE